MKKIIIPALLAFLLSIAFVFAHAEDNFTDTKKLIDSNISCDKLTDSQLEEIGEYYMEQMHPGESHEAMHKMMGFTEGSKEEVQFHINLAKAMYCSNSTFGMMGMMQSGGMMGGGMMGNYWASGSVLFTTTIVVWLIVGVLAIFWLLRSLLSKKNKQS